MVFSRPTQDLVLVKVFRQEKGYDNEWSHCFIGDNCERVWFRVVTETCFGRV